MADVKWIKITVDMFEHEKLDFILSLPESDAIIIVWIRLLTLAGKVNASGYVLLTENIAYTEEMLSHKFRKPPSVVRLALETLRRLKMIEFEGTAIRIINWDKHQNVDGLEKIKEQDRLRQQKKRDKAKHLQLESGMSRDNHVTVTDDVTLGHATDIELELDLELDKEKDIYIPIIEDTEIIFKHWNTKKIIMHRTLTAVMKGKIHARLEDLTVDEMLEAINNYFIVISDSEKYWYNHRFTLLEFVNPKNLDRFLTENNPFEALKKNVISFNKDKPSNVKTGIPDMSETQKHLDEMTRLQEAKKKRIAERVSS